MRSHFKHSVELVDDNGEIVDQLAGVEDFMLAKCGGEALTQGAHPAVPAVQDSRGLSRMTTLTLRRIKGDFVVAGPGVSPPRFKSRREGKEECRARYRGSPIREIGSR